jgi:tetratricopeptide (TPR) repeat protein/CheY-like chemotaxis protein
MKKVFLITDDAPLREALTTSAEQLGASVETNDEWSEAKDSLFKDRFDAVCIDYDAIKIEGLDAFILLDNILQKEQTPGVLILRKSSPRAKQFISSLDSFHDSIELEGAEPSAQRLVPHLETLLAVWEKIERSEGQDDGDAPVVVEVHLPSLAEGTLGKVSLARLLYALDQACASGVLQLASGSIKRRYAISEGQAVDTSAANFSDLETLASAFAWQDGSYKFKQGKVPGGQTVPMLELINKSIDRHVPQRRVMQALMPHMKDYPTPTNLWSKRRDRLRDLDILDDLAAACDGKTSLEQVLASLGAKATAGFKTCLFARHTDLFMLRNVPTPGGITVQYDAAVAQAQQQRVEEEKKASKAYRATGTGRLDLEEELRDFLDEIEQATPYEIFDVWEGCGRAPIQSKFYEMVKSHHPDVYGGNVSGDVKRLAQEIFIAVKDAYTELLKVEREQTRPDPGQKDAPGQNESSAVMTDTGPGTQSSPGTRSSDTSTDRLRARTPSPRPSVSETSSGLSDEMSFGAEKADEITDSARKSRIERLKAKRRATPIGLSREPSTPIVEGKSRKSEIREGTDERRARIDKIRKNSTPGLAASTTGVGDKDDLAKRAFNEGYKAWRENENKEVAFEKFSTAYNLEPDNGKYMTFYGYLLFLSDPDKQNEAQKVLEKAIQMKDRQSLPDAHVFMGHVLKVQDKPKQAMGHFKKALELNPKSREAERELRLYQMRKKEESEGEGSKFLKNLFKK